MVNRLNIEGIGMTSKRTRDRLIQRLQEQGIKNARVLEVIAATPRHWFLDEALAHRAYEDTALPIGFGQTLSQPYIVARMTELLFSAKPELSKVLEVGTGSGYQTVVLAQLVTKLWSVERIRPLQIKARERIRQLNLYNVQLKHADGTFGWPECGPYDGILSAAAPAKLPEELCAQLSIGGVLVIPVGEHEQTLTVVNRVDEKEFKIRKVESVRFVPLLSGVTR